MTDHQTGQEERFKDWVRKELKDTQRAMYSMFQVIKHLEDKIDGNNKPKARTQKTRKADGNNPGSD